MQKIEEWDYKPDFEILDRYLNFSSELLRLSLLGITGFGSLLILSFAKDSKLQFTSVVKDSFFIAIIFLGLCAAFCLVHRFVATDYMSYHVKYLRTSINQERIEGKKQLKRSGYALIIAEYTFALGMIAFMFGIYFLIFSTK